MSVPRHGLKHTPEDLLGPVWPLGSKPPHFQAVNLESRHGGQRQPEGEAGPAVPDASTSITGQENNVEASTSGADQGTQSLRAGNLYKVTY